MATITRRYVSVGPSPSMLGRYVGPTAAVDTYPADMVDLDIDDDPNMVATLDEYMETMGYGPSATASPKQVFRYVATGAEANPVTIGAGQGFIARATANYNVQITLGGPIANAFKQPRALVASFAIGSFDVESTAPLELGDVIQFTVEDLS